GGCMSGRGHCVVVCGRPLMVPQYIERVTEQFAEHFDRRLRAAFLPDGDRGGLNTGSRNV
ncbi:MAG: hypothetical protein ACOCSK_01865, partial [Rhodothermales bacterium]